MGRQFDHGSKFQTLPPTPKQFSLEAWREFLMEQEGPDNIVLQMHNYLKYGEVKQMSLTEEKTAAIFFFQGINPPVQKK